MDPDEFLSFVKRAAADEREHSQQWLNDVMDAGDRVIAQAAAGEVISAASLIIREQERTDPT